MGKPLLSVGAVAAMLVLAGCSGGMPGGGEQSGSMAFYVSDQPGAIDDFEHLNVTVTKVGVHKVNASSAENGTWIETDFDNVTVDLTELQGENAANLANASLPNGTYNNAFIHVSAVEGATTDGEQVDVKLPSSKLHVAENFTVGAAEESHFVFDVMVHETGNGKYVLRPNAGDSGKNVPVKPTPGAKQSGQAGASGETTTTAQSGTSAGTTTQSEMAVYLSDRPGAIGDFDHLNVTVSAVGVHRQNDSDNESAWVEQDVDSVTVDVTELQGDRAVSLANFTLENGTYDTVFVHVAWTNGTLTNGEHVPVKLPSSKLKLHQEFTVGDGNTTHFVYDVMVHETGSGKYVLKPNVAESGPNEPVTKVSKKNAKPDDDTPNESDTSNETTTTTQSGDETTAQSGNETATTTTATTTTATA
ncbi:DUF4382 domain-containing protein [Halocalculus aciditolerans]|uniref:DUF4382 domain-containing protein n=1 Tax=Halocalculus aciditolerans TaxID=1383812 RepID=A0A830FL88_9EURY|nr:DUF4382 domain-containing protein [Halocalculus aciditolerans]GGL63651.1 hypothetical protein GCM10009039_21960 [Halocalculus aciditolerans]